VVVSGALTLHTDSGNADSEAVLVRGLLQEKIENGEFDGSQSEIVRVSYVVLTPGSNANNNNNNVRNSGGNNDDLPIGVISAAAAGSFFFIIGAVAYGRRRKSNSAADASTVTPVPLSDSIKA
jgi:hypothetical protein